MRNKTWRVKWKVWLAGALAMCMAAGLLAMPTGRAQAAGSPSIERPQGSDGVYNYLINRDGTVEIIKYKGEGRTVEVPESLNGNKVTVIGQNAFKECKSLDIIVLPSGVKEIGASAFEGCDSLTSIELPAGVRIIGEKAFYSCKKLRKVEILSSVCKIGVNAFHYLDEKSGNSLPLSTLTIYGTKGSTAASYATSNGIRFESMAVDVSPGTDNPNQPGNSEKPTTGGQTGTQNPPTTGGQTGTQNPPTSTGGTTGSGNSSQKPTEQPKPSLPVITQTTVTATVGENSAPVKKESVAIESAVVNLVSQIATQEKPEITTKERVPDIDQNVLKSAKDQKKDITFSVTNDTGDLLYSWSFSGKNLDPSKVTKSMNLTMSFDTEKKDEIEKQTGIKSGLYLAINNYEGALPGPATVRTYVGGQYANGDIVYVYYYNEDKKRAELPVQGQRNACTVVSGYITYTLTHCSIYFVSNQEPSKYGIQDESQAQQAPQAQQPTQTSPKTGDSAAMGAWALAVALSAAAAGCLWRRRAYSAR